MRYLSIAVVSTLDYPLTYSLDNNGTYCDLGCLVIVPLGNRSVLGIVWSVCSKGDIDVIDKSIGLKKIKKIKRILPSKFKLNEEHLLFLQKFADYNLTPIGLIADLAVRALSKRFLTVNDDDNDLEYQDSGSILNRDYRIAIDQKCLDDHLKPLSEQQKKVLDSLSMHSSGIVTENKLAKISGVSLGVVKKLFEYGILRKESGRYQHNDSQIIEPIPETNSANSSIGLSPDQYEAFKEIGAACKKGDYAAFLLYGVTGSGKTEVYIKSIKTCLEEGKQVLVLMPEIALTDSFISFIESRLGIRAIKWHSAVQGKKRSEIWEEIALEGPCVVVGARSALFLPFNKLALIIVDEEHDVSYKQEENAVYNARDMAVLRAYICSAVVTLCTATPSIESWVNGVKGKYKILRLNKRYGKSKLPEISAIDIRSRPLQKNLWISDDVVKEVKEHLSRGHQAMLFINRRGYAPLTLCKKCGHRFNCPHCAAWLVEHRAREIMLCHYCNYSINGPFLCPSCDTGEHLVSCGPGVERLEEEASRVFTDANIVSFSSDIIRKPGELKKRLFEIKSCEKNLIIGTQILAKGHHFPNLTLVSVIDADSALYGGDFRAAERTWQMIRQVAGRAGREEKPGRVILQTAFIDHPVMRILINGNDDEFLKSESDLRYKTHSPPFGRYVALVLSDKNEKRAWESARQLMKSSTVFNNEDIKIFGPSPAPVPYIKDKTRLRILLKMDRDIKLLALVKKWTKSVKLPSSLKLVLDVDPYSFS